MSDETKREINDIRLALAGLISDLGLGRRGVAALNRALREMAGSETNIALINKALNDFRTIITDAANSSHAKWSGDATDIKKVTDLIENLSAKTKFLNEQQRQQARGFGLQFGGTGEAAAPEVDPTIRTPESMGNFLKSNYLSANEALAKLNETLKAYGFSFEDISNVHKVAGTDITRISAATETLDGNLRTVDFTMDRLGGVTEVTSTKFRSLAGNIVKNAAEFAKWAVGATLLFGVLRQLQESIQIIITNQSELATISVALGDSNIELSEVFDAVANAANRTSESIEGVLQGYTQAIRAAGRYANESERVEVANTLLTDSLILSKLSTLDQSNAMDTLVAALSQSNIPLNEGRKLLDTWVATTKIANVDLRTLAESYAIMATTAKNAGIEVGATNNELVGLIAVLAEQTQLSPTETGNALRAVVSGLNTDVAIQSLQNFGISVTDVTGEFIGFIEILEELSFLVKSGIISDSELSEIARAIGGGVRRQVNVEVIIRDLARAQQINEAVSKSSGDAMGALEKQTETVQSSITRMSNAFVELSQTLGAEGGVIGFISDLVSMLTTLLKAVNEVTDVIGDAGLGGILLGGAALYGVATKQKLTQAMPLKFNTMQYGSDAGSMLFAPAVAAGTQGMEDRNQTRVFGNALTAALGVFATTGSAVISNLKKGETEEAAGAGVGGIIGTAVGWGLTHNPLGAIAGAQIGTMIGESFVRLVAAQLEVSGSLGAAFVKISAYLEADPEEPPEVSDDYKAELEKELELQIRDIVVQLVIDSGFAHPDYPKMSAESLIDNLKTSTYFKDMVEEGAGRAVPMDYDTYSEIDKLAYILSGLDFEAFQEFSRQVNDSGLSDDISYTSYQQRGLDIVDQNKEYIDAQVAGLTAQYENQKLTREISGEDYESRITSLGGIDSFITQVLPAIFDNSNQPEASEVETKRIGDMSLTAEETIKFFFPTLIGLDDAAKSILTARAATFAGLEDDLSQETDPEEKKYIISQLLELFHKMIEGLFISRERQIIADYEPTAVISGGGATQQDLGKIRTEYDRLLEAERKRAFTKDGVDIENREVIEGNWEDATFRNADIELAPGVFINILEALGLTEANLDILRKAFEGIVGGAGAGGSASILEVPFAYGSDAYNQIFGADGGGGKAYNALDSKLSQFPGWITDVAGVIVKSSENELASAEVDSRIVQMLLGLIAENTEDMVDGIYNLPTDGTFTVPYTGAYATKGGAGGLTYEDFLNAFEVMFVSGRGGTQFDPYTGTGIQASHWRPSWRENNPIVGPFPEGVEPYDIFSQLGASASANQTQTINIQVDANTTVVIDGDVLGTKLDRYFARAIIHGGSGRRNSPTLTL